jgi:hypothetical protein
MYNSRDILVAILQLATLAALLSIVLQPWASLVAMCPSACACIRYCFSLCLTRAAMLAPLFLSGGRGQDDVVLIASLALLLPVVWFRLSLSETA